MLWILKEGMFAHSEDGAKLDKTTDEIADQFIEARIAAAEDPARNIFAVRSRAGRLESRGATFWIAKYLLGEGYQFQHGGSRWNLLPDGERVQTAGFHVGRLGLGMALEELPDLRDEPWALEPRITIADVRNPSTWEDATSSIAPNLGSAIAKAEELLILNAGIN